jgi:hypothetical protein
MRPHAAGLLAALATSGALRLAPRAAGRPARAVASRVEPLARARPPRSLLGDVSVPLDVYGSVLYSGELAGAAPGAAEAAAAAAGGSGSGALAGSLLLLAVLVRALTDSAIRRMPRYEFPEVRPEWVD